MSIQDVHLNIAKIGAVKEILHSQPYKLPRNNMLSFLSTISVGFRTTVFCDSIELLRTTAFATLLLRSSKPSMGGGGGGKLTTGGLSVSRLLTSAIARVTPIPMGIFMLSWAERSPSGIVRTAIAIINPLCHPSQYAPSMVRMFRRASSLEDTESAKDVQRTTSP